jgi:hypothetical protein
VEEVSASGIFANMLVMFSLMPTIRAVVDPVAILSEHGKL